MIIQFADDEKNAYTGKVVGRFYRILSATQEMIKKFVELGYTTEQANQMIGQLSSEVKDHILLYALGLTDPIEQAVQASELPFMTQEVKDYCLELLSD